MLGAGGASQAAAAGHQEQDGLDELSLAGLISDEQDSLGELSRAGLFPTTVRRRERADRQFYREVDRQREAASSLQGPAARQQHQLAARAVAGRQAQPAAARYRAFEPCKCGGIRRLAVSTRRDRTNHRTALPPVRRRNVRAADGGVVQPAPGVRCGTL